MIYSEWSDSWDHALGLLLCLQQICNGMTFFSILAKQKGVNLTDDDIDLLSREKRCKFIQSDPVTVARHFDHRVQLFMKHILFNKKLNPVGKVVDYKYRIEFQHRGSPHVHMLVWVENVPQIEDNTAEEVQEFIYSHITCELSEDDELAHLVKTLQTHNHSQTCKKHGQVCRFQFPRLPMPKTLVILPQDDTPSPDTVIEYQTFWWLCSKNWLVLTSIQICQLMPSLKKIGVPEGKYIDAVGWLKTRHGQPAVLLKRGLREVNINNYNSTFMRAWQANLDIQYVTNVYACVMYLASYVSKPE